jgi:hypothetical protein
MTTFDNREKAFEEKFAHDEELRFKAHVKAAKLMGEWAALEIGLSADVYASELVNMVTGGKKDEALFEKIQKDAINKGKTLSIAAITEKFIELQNQALQHVIKH